MSDNPILRDSGNRLLDRLPACEFGPLESLLESMSLTQRMVLQQFESEVEYVFFPTTAMLSLLTILEEDDPIESMTVGREGFVGTAASLGVDSSPHRVICQMPGEVYRLPLRSFREALGNGPGLTRMIQRYLAYALRTTSQTAACNILHTIEARASRWLLLVHDQAHHADFPMTQEFLAFMLGVRRQSVTVVAPGCSRTPA